MFIASLYKPGRQTCAVVCAAAAQIFLFTSASARHIAARGGASWATVFLFLIVVEIK